MPHIKELKNTTEISDLCHKTNELTLNKLEMYQDIAISEYQIDIGETKDAILAIQEMRKKYGL
ncbi:hypothetical protein [Holdemanella biformis]|uniref:Uncharacterized protein n=1 Tax=Holdemanella biformis TaxID=1735 RepID=A0A413UCY2_9FIRM|nr:hypothetical protein [Holdemanella biformis]MBD9053291.1 hypothetical protein [Holdemanella biformis]RHB06987.1 hypothetical protein DW907_05490 [Holdemanella biformis]